MKYLNLLIIILASVFCNLSFAYEIQPSYYLTEGDLYSMQFSPDGSYLAVVLSTGLRLYRPDSGELLTQIVQDQPPEQVEISSDGRTIVGLFDRSAIKIWSVDGEKIETQATIETEAHLLALSPDTKRLAVSKDDDIFLWDLTTLEKIGKLEDERGPVIGTSWPLTTALEFSPNRKKLAVGSRRRAVEIWDVKTRKIEQKFDAGRDDWIERVAFSPDGKLLAVSCKASDRKVQIWNVPDGQLMCYLYTNYRVEGFNFSSDSQRLIVGIYPTEWTGKFQPRPEIQIWDVQSEKKLNSFEIKDGGYDLLDNIVLSPDDKAIAVSGNGVINFWDVQNARKIDSWQKNFTPFLGNMDLSPNGRYFMSSSWPPMGKILKIWDTENNQIELILESEKWFTNAIFLDNESIMIIDALDYAARVDIRTGEKEKLFSNLPSGSFIGGYVMALSPNRQELAIASDWGQVYIYNLEEPDKPPKELRPDDEKDGYIRTMTYSNDGRYLAVGMETDDEDYGWVIIWKKIIFKKIPYTTYEFKLIESRKVHNYSLYNYFPSRAIAFSDDGRLLATAGYPSKGRGRKSEVKIWRVNGWKLLGHLKEAGSPIAFSFDGKRLLTWSDEGGTLWDWRRERKIATLLDAEYCWLSDNKEVLLTVQNDGRLAVWNIRPLLMPMFTTFGEIKRSALLQNYPNPFNPETWIPFRLAEDAEVSIRIYDVVGQLVRDFDLGRLSSGAYIEKDKAFYWNGRNENGEEVSSSIYFYTFKANDFSQTKKMGIVR